MNTISVCLCFDDKYSIYGATTIRSMMTHTKSAVHVYILSDYISERNTKNLCGLANQFTNLTLEIKIVSVEDIAGLKLCSYLGLGAYYRLLMYRYITDEIERLIYIDADILVLGDIKELWTQEIGDKIFGAVRTGKKVKSHDQLTRFGVTKYFNSGVLLIDWRRRLDSNISEDTINFIAEHEDVISIADQDGLNVVGKDSRALLDCKFNYTSAYIEYGYKLTDSKKPIIRHFTGNVKPWHFMYPFLYSMDTKKIINQDYLLYNKFFKEKSLIFYVLVPVYFLNNFLHYIGLYYYIISLYFIAKGNPSK